MYVTPVIGLLYIFNHYHTEIFFQFEITISGLVSSSDSFEYLCYGSTAIINILILSVRRLSFAQIFCTAQIDKD